MFVPNENSGPCYTYTPPFDSEPGDANNMFMTFDFSRWDPALEIFLHDKNQFFYSANDILSTKRITADMLNRTKIKDPRTVGRE